MEQLTAPLETQREAAFLALGEKPGEIVVPALARLLLLNPSSEAQAACLDLLARFGALVEMRAARVDDWFDKICEQINGVRAVAELMGPRFLAYSMVLGLQIRKLVKDPHAAANTMVEFDSGDGEPQALALGEFKIRSVQALLRRRYEPPKVSLPLTDEDAVKLVGPTALLLAPLFDLRIESVTATAESPQRVVIGFLSQVGMTYLDWPAFDALLGQLVTADLRGASEEPFRIDLAAVEAAKEASARGDHGAVIRALETWPGLLAALQRTPVAKKLTAQQVSLIGEGLLLLGGAFEIEGRASWSEELYRLGLQILREHPPAPELFFRLGALFVAQERWGEAIGVLRRAHALGVESSRTLPPLARSLLRRGKIVGAALLLGELEASGTFAPGLAEDLEEARAAARKAGAHWLVDLTASGAARATSFE